jgi:hypothetical protein
MKWIIILLASVATAWAVSYFFPGVHGIAFPIAGYPVSWLACIFCGTVVFYAHCLKKGR